MSEFVKIDLVREEDKEPAFEISSNMDKHEVIGLLEVALLNLKHTAITLTNIKK